MQVALVYLGTLIGAGFASGRELWLFFASLGINGLKSMLCAGLLFSVLGFAVIIFAHKNHCFDFQKMLLSLYPKYFAFIVDKICFLFLLLSLSIMYSAFAHLWQDAFQIPLLWSYGILFLFLFLCLRNNEKGISWVNICLVPFMLLFMLFLAGAILIQHREGSFFMPIEQPTFFSVLWQAGLYVGYNFFSCFAVLIPFAKGNYYAAKWAGLGGVFLGGLGCVFVLSLQLVPESASYQMPFFYLASQISPIFAYIYTFVLTAAIITTAAGNAYALQKRLSALTSHNFAFLIPSLALPMVFWGDFTFLVGKIYPFFGYLGFGLIFSAVFLVFIRNKNRKR